MGIFCMSGLGSLRNMAFDNSLRTAHGEGGRACPSVWIDKSVGVVGK